MGIRIRFIIACLLVAAVTGKGISRADAEEKQTGRPGITMTVNVDGKVAKITVTLDYLTSAKARPRVTGVRQYTYDVTFGGGPTQVGWTTGKEPQSVLLRSQKYVFTRGHVDRQENGSLSLTEEAEPATYRICGVYHYMDQLFVVDHAVKAGEALLLYEQVQEK